jgi:hypothetical protein
VDLVPKLPGIFPYRHVTDAINLYSLTLIPPRVLLQPNPICWHILTSYIYLMQLSAGIAGAAPEQECAAIGGVRDILGKIEADLGDTKSIADSFTASLRTNLGGNF